MTVRIYRVLCAVLAGLALLAGNALAIDSLKMLVPAAPGGGWDQTARNLQAAMQQAGVVKNITVSNTPGAAGTVGLAQFINNSKGDAQAVMIGGMVMVGGVILNKSPVNMSALTPIARLTSEYEAIVVPASSPLKNMDDLVKQLKANPGSVSWGGGSAGGVDHILAAMIAKEAGVDASKVNYIPFAGGGEAANALLGGHVTAGVSGWGEFQAQVKAGKLRALAVSSANRIAGVDVPTLKEQGINIELGNWRGVFGAPEISKAQRDELIKAITAATKSAAWEETLKKMNWTSVLLTGDEFKTFLDEENKRVSTILAESGLIKK